MGPRTATSLGLLRAVAFAAIALAAPLARAGGLEVQPVVVTLTAKTSNAVLNIRNAGQEAGRFQVSLTSWTQGKDGAILTEPSKDLIVFPELFKLQAGASRNLRIGVKASRFGAVEKTYRVFITELPSASKAAGPNVRVLTRLGIPVFLAPTAGPGAQGALSGLSVQGGQVSFSLTNPGNVHFKPLQIRLKARGADSALLAERQWPGWYVLAGGERLFQDTLRSADCKQVRNLHVELDREGGSTLESDLATPQGVCAL